MIPEGALTLHLKAILGTDGFVRLCQALGGTRAYIPYNPRDDNEIIQALGREQAEKLCRELAPATIRIPLARRDRALAYRAEGLSNARIARQLGITESSVAKLFGRESNLPERRKSASKAVQLELF